LDSESFDVVARTASLSVYQISGSSGSAYLELVPNGVLSGGKLTVTLTNQATSVATSPVVVKTFANPYYSYYADYIDYYIPTTVTAGAYTATVTLSGISGIATITKTTTVTIS
jgi:hypothetical protein